MIYLQLIFFKNILEDSNRAKIIAKKRKRLLAQSECIFQQNNNIFYE